MNALGAWAWKRLTFATLFLVALQPVISAQAHPHVFADAQVQIVGDGSGKIVALRNIWQMDELFSSTVLVQFDQNSNGKFDPEELDKVAQTVGQSIAEYSFYTFLRADDTAVPLSPPTEMGADFRDGRLLLFFEMRLPTPLDATTHKVVVSNFDESFYVAFDYADADSFVLNDMPKSCRKSLVIPDEEEAAQKWAQQLGPPAADQPADGVDYVKILAGRVELDCSVATVTAR